MRTEILLSEILPYIPVAEGIVELFYPNVEVVFHDLETGKIVKILNNYSKRKVGDSSLLEKDIDQKEIPDVFAPYCKTNWDGRKLKSTTITIKNEQQKPVAFMCINVDISMLDVAQKAINAFCMQTEKRAPSTLFQEDWQEKISHYVHEYVQEHKLVLKALNKTQRHTLIEALFHDGAFRAPKAVDYAAAVLGISRATAYKYLASIKNNTSKETL